MFLAVIHGHLAERIENLDDLLAVPLGVHPESTPEAKALRQARLREIEQWS